MIGKIRIVSPRGRLCPKCGNPNVFPSSANGCLGKKGHRYLCCNCCGYTVAIQKRPRGGK